MEYFDRKVFNIQIKIKPVTKRKAFTIATIKITSIKM